MFAEYDQLLNPVTRLHELRFLGFQCPAASCWSVVEASLSRTLLNSVYVSLTYLASGAENGRSTANGICRLQTDSCGRTLRILSGVLRVQGLARRLSLHRRAPASFLRRANHPISGLFDPHRTVSQEKSLCLSIAKKSPVQPQAGPASFHAA